MQHRTCCEAQDASGTRGGLRVIQGTRVSGQPAASPDACTGQCLSVFLPAQGHAAWVSSAESRQRVFAERARSDAVVVGGQTVRRDNPRLTTRSSGGHTPVRVVMSRTLDLPKVSCWGGGGAGAMSVCLSDSARGR
jgi:RibD C-terminal domain